MAVPTVNITGTLRDGSGAAVSGVGALSIKLNGLGYVSDGVNNLEIPNQIFVVPVIDGVIDFNLIPCSSITKLDGSNPRWIVSYNVPYFVKAVETWNLGATDPVDITAIPKE